METEWLTIDKAAERADVSRSTIYSWIRERRVRICRTVGGKHGSTRIDAASLFRIEPKPYAPESPA